MPKPDVAGLCVSGELHLLSTGQIEICDVAVSLHLVNNAFFDLHLFLPLPSLSLSLSTLPLTFSHSLLYFCVSPVPFREAPAYSKRRRAPQSSLSAPRVLLRSNSDNNLNSSAVGAGPDAHPQRSLSPQLLQQMQRNPNGTVRTMGRGSRAAPRSRSPSLSRLGEEQRRQQLR